MELVVAIVSALIGLSAAFFLSIAFYDSRLEDWAFLSRSRGPSTFDPHATGRHPLIPRTIKQTPLG
jgi:hypothetical protein